MVRVGNAPVRIRVIKVILYLTGIQGRTGAEFLSPPMLAHLPVGVRENTE